MSRVEIVAAEAFDAEAVLSIYAPYILTTPMTFETEVPTVSEGIDEIVCVVNDGKEFWINEK